MEAASAATTDDDDAAAANSSSDHADRDAQSSQSSCRPTPRPLSQDSLTIQDLMRRSTATTTTRRDSLNILRLRSKGLAGASIDYEDDDVGDGTDAFEGDEDKSITEGTENMTESLSSLDPIIPRESSAVDRVASPSKPSSSSTAATATMERTATTTPPTTSTSSYSLEEAPAAVADKKRRILETASLLLVQDAGSGRRRSVTAGRIIRGLQWSAPHPPPLPPPPLLKSSSSSGSICSITGSSGSAMSSVVKPTTGSNTAISTNALPATHNYHHSSSFSSSSPSRPHLRSSLKKSTSPALLNRNKNYIMSGTSTSSSSSSTSNNNNNNKTVSFSERLVDYLGGSRNSILNNASISSLNTSISLFDDVFADAATAASFSSNSNMNMNNMSNINFNASGSASLSSSLTMGTAMMPPLASSASSTSFATAAAAARAAASRRGSLYMNESFQMSLDCLDEMQTFKEEQDREGSSSSILSWTSDSSFAGTASSLRPIDEHSHTHSTGISSSSAAAATTTSPVAESDAAMEEHAMDMDVKMLKDCKNDDTASDSSVTTGDEHEKNNRSAGQSVNTDDTVHSTTLTSTITPPPPPLPHPHPLPPPRIITPPTGRHHKHRRVHTYDETMSYQRLRNIVLHCQEDSRSIKQRPNRANATSTSTADMDNDRATTATTTSPVSSSYIQKTCSDDLWIMVHSNHASHGCDDGNATTTTTTTTATTTAAASSTLVSSTPKNPNVAVGTSTPSRYDSPAAPPPAPEHWQQQPLILDDVSTTTSNDDDDDDDSSFVRYEKGQPQGATTAAVDLCFHSWLSLVLQDDDDDDDDDDNVEENQY